MSEALNYKNGSIQANISQRIESLQDYIKDRIPSKGDKEEFCQQLTILNRLSDVEYAVDSLTDEDFKEASE